MGRPCTAEQEGAGPSWEGLRRDPLTEESPWFANGADGDKGLAAVSIR